MLVNANALRIPLPDESVHMVVTSPPYWSLRDYGIPGQLGLEETPEAYVANMVAVFREVWRVLRKDGVAFVNLGDSYARQAGCNSTRGTPNTGQANPARMAMERRGNNRPPLGLKEKDLCGIPWRVAFALQADGWWLRSEITWCKKAPMPESVRDRPTTATEKLFLFAKSPRYFYDSDAVRVPSTGQTGGAANFARNSKEGWTPGQSHVQHRDGRTPTRDTGTRNLWNYWILGPEPYSGAHFATFPCALVEPCIKAGTSERGVCPACGAPWERVTSDQVIPEPEIVSVSKLASEAVFARGGNQSHLQRMPSKSVTTTGWLPTCDHHREGYYWCWDCNITKHISELKRGCPDCGETMVPAPLEPQPAIVLDPFVGSGTTLVVARALGRLGIGLDLSYPYLRDQARVRLELDKLDQWGEAREAQAAWDGLPLFAEGEPLT